jgi:hypothetical protein
MLKKLQELQKQVEQLIMVELMEVLIYLER